MLETYKLIEYIVIGSVICLQIWQFIRTLFKMNQLRNAIPSQDNYHLVNAYIPISSELKSIRSVIGWFHELYRSNFGSSTNQNYEKEGDTIYGDVSLIKIDRRTSFIDEIVYILNTYLIKNTGAAADFHLIKDIVERNIDKEEQQIHVMIPIPLYMGLGGTMFGIIIGLFSMPSVSGGLSTATELGIDALINGVKLAMVASLSGLFFTTFASFRFQSLKGKVETAKNGFYNFIQSQLLPVLSESVQSSAQILKNDFANFNKEFSKNITSLNKLVTNNLEAFRLQNQALEKFEKLDVNKMATSNLMTFQLLQKSMDDLKRLGEYILSMNIFIENTKELGDTMSHILERTEAIEVIATEVRGTFEEHRNLNKFLNSHFEELEDRKKLILQAVQNTDNGMKAAISNSERSRDEVLEKIGEATREKVQAVKQKMIDEYNELSKVVFKNTEWIKEQQILIKTTQNLDKHLATNEQIQNKMIQRLDKIEKTALSTSKEIAKIEKSPLGGGGYELLPVGIQKVIPAFQLTSKVVGFLTIIIALVALIKYLFF